MRTIAIAIMFMLALNVVAHAEAIPLISSYTETNKWLAGNNLSLTGGPGVRDDLSAFGQETLLFYGEAAGNPEHRTIGQRSLMAKRAAVVTAQRALMEYLEGFVLVGATVVGDGMIQADLIVSVVGGFVKGSQVVLQEYNNESDTAIALIKLGMRGPKGFASTFYEKMNSDPKFKESLKTDKKPFKTQVTKLDETYDGLIIDATEQNFRPALINRIFATKGDVLYDPVNISQKVLVEQGCGEYTNSVDKAKTALVARGVNNPLVIKASGTTTAADLQVTDYDAVIIYSANQKGNFMAAAKVAFVLK